MDVSDLRAAYNVAIDIASDPTATAAERERARRRARVLGKRLARLRGKGGDDGR